MKLRIGLILMLTCLGKMTMSQNWQWAKAIRSDQIQSYEVGSVISDGSNFYVYGDYDNILTFPDSLYPDGSNEIFVAKYDALGNKLWKRAFGSSATIMPCFESIYIIYSPNENYLYATGLICGTTTFGSNQLSTAGLSDVFLAKLDTNGQFIWAKSFGGTGNEQTRIYRDNLGGIYLGCSISSTCTIDTFTANPGGIVAKFDTSGNCKWVLNCLNGPEENEILINFIEDDLLIGGGYKSNSTIGIGITATLNNNNSTLDAFFTRMDTLGNIKWVEYANTTGIDFVSDIKVDNSLNMYVSMTYTDSVLIDSTKILAQGISSSILKLDKNGQLLDYNQFHCSGDLIGTSQMVLNPDGSLFLHGTFSLNADLDGHIFNSTYQRNMYLAGLDANLDCFGVKSIENSIGLSLCEDANHDLVCSGLYYSNSTFGSTTLNTLKAPDIYLAKISAITGVGEFERNTNAEGLVIYENPNSGSFNIKIPEIFSSASQLRLDIYDSTGKLIESGNIEIADIVTEVKLNKKIAKGVYLVSISDETEKFTGRMIVQ